MSIRGRALCPWCKHEYALRGDNTFRLHRDQNWGGMCLGSHRPRSAYKPTETVAEPGIPPNATELLALLECWADDLRAVLSVTS